MIMWDRLFGKKKFEKMDEEELRPLAGEKSEKVATNSFTTHLNLFHMTLSLLEELKKPLDLKLPEGGKNYLEVIMRLQVKEIDLENITKDQPLLKAMENLSQVITNLKLVSTYLKTPCDDPEISGRFDYFKTNNEGTVKNLLLAYGYLEDFLQNTLENLEPIKETPKAPEASKHDNFKMGGYRRGRG